MNTKRKRHYFYHDMANHLQVASRMSPEDGNAYLEEMIQKSGIKLKNIKHTDQKVLRVIKRQEMSNEPKDQQMKPPAEKKTEEDMKGKDSSKQKGIFSRLFRKK